MSFRAGEPIGSQTLHGRAFPVTRTVRSGSWLGLAHQRQGRGSEQRAAVLGLALRGHGPRAAETGALATNHTSRRVSEKLGYRFAFEDTLSPRGTAPPI